MNRKLTSYSRRWLACVAFAGIIIALIVFAPDWWVISKYKPQIAFNDELWLEGGNSSYESQPVTPRQQMIRDLITNVLPGKERKEIESLLGPSKTHEEMQKHTDADMQVREKDENGNWKPFPRTGKGYYFDEYEWDLIYVIGLEQILIYDHYGAELSPDPEHLIIRFDKQGRFQSWFLEGSDRWPSVVGKKALTTFREKRFSSVDSK